ncbi:MAG: hypothetical protein Q8S13_09455, partial [Dehalococcoidia bacterium]|nr:hypothetical protein [Dehalococcoidia bacterium]
EIMRAELERTRAERDRAVEEAERLRSAGPDPGALALCVEALTAERAAEAAREVAFEASERNDRARENEDDMDEDEYMRLIDEGNKLLDEWIAARDRHDAARVATDRALALARAHARGRVVATVETDPNPKGETTP